MKILQYFYWEAYNVYVVKNFRILFPDEIFCLIPDSGKDIRRLRLRTVIKCVTIYENATQTELLLL